MRRLVIAGAVGIAGTLVAAIFAWARTKGLAVALGPADFGVYGQLATFVLYAGVLASLGFGIGTTKIIATELESGTPTGLSLVFTVTVAVPAAAGVLLFFVALGASSPVSSALIDSDEVLLVALAVMSIPFIAVQAPLQHVLQGFKDAVAQNVVYAVYALVFAVASVAGAVIAGVGGALVGLAVGNVFLAALYYYRGRSLLGRAGSSPGLFRAASEAVFGHPIAKELLRIGAASLAVTVAFAAADLAVRTTLLHSRGEDVTGLWHGLLLISVQGIGALAGWLSYLTAPIAAEASSRQDQAGVQSVIDDSIRLGLAAVVPFILVITALRDPLVEILFSEEFRPMGRHLPTQMFGDLLRTLAWIPGVALVPLGYTKAWLGIGVGSSLLFGALGSLAADRWGLGGATAAWVVVWGAAAVATLSVLHLRKSWSPSVRVVLGAAVAAITLGAVASLSAGPGLGAVALGLVVLAFVVVRPRERATALELVRGLLRIERG
jgi:O-antigen/teichoic acid export membrane protein